MLQIRRSGYQIVYQMLKRMKRYSPETFDHSFSVARMAGKLGAVLGYSPEDVCRLNLAGVLHDVGKLSIPLEILHKRGKLDETEWSIMQMHPEIGRKLLCPYISDDTLLLAVGQHHERLDGGGYPTGLAGGEISEFSKIVMLADVYDGLTRKRAYRTKMIDRADAKAIMYADKARYDQTYLQAFLDDVV